MGVLPHRLDPLPADLAGEHRANRFHQNRTVSWQISMPRSASRSSTLRGDRGYFTYMSTTSRMISGEELKRRQGLGGLRLAMAKPDPQTPTSRLV